MAEARSPGSRGAGPLVREVRLGVDRGRPAVLADGVVQSVAPSTAAGGYWEAMLPEHRPRRALLLGFGAGTLAHLLVDRFGPLPIVGVDNDPRMLALARSAFGPLPPNVDLVLADAFAFVELCAGRFDYVAVDLFRAGHPARGVTGQPFLRALRRALMPGGRVAFNLFRDAHTARRLRRIATRFTVTHVKHVRDNVVVHARR
jgi:spermidine synthase